jgi:hypothetical protein
MKTKMLFSVLAISLALFAGLTCAQSTTDSSVSSPNSANLNVSLASQSPDPARSGEMVELRFTIENTGGRASNDLTLELVIQYPFTEIPGEEYTKSVSALRAYQQGVDAVTVKFKVRVDKDAIKGANQIKLRRTESGSTTSVIQSFDVDVTGSEYAQIIYVDKSILSPGEETPLKFTITNVGTSPLQNLVFSWNEQNGVILPVYSDDTKYIKYIDVGESTDVEYTVVADVNTDPGLYQLDLTLKFDAESGAQEMNTKAGIFVGGGTDFDVTFSESSAGQTSLSVANIGNNPALSVTVSVPDQEGYSVSGSKSSIIGNLDKGDYTIVSFQISQSMTMRINRTSSQVPSAAQSSNLNVHIEYTDTTGKRHTLEKSVPIQFRTSTSDSTTTASGFGQQSSATSGYLMYAAIAAIVVAGFVCYRKREFLRSRLRRSRREGDRNRLHSRVGKA